MSDDDQKQPQPAAKPSAGKSNEATARDARLNAALRANLQKRKQQVRKRTTPTDTEVAKATDSNEG